jgi:hypothetical protein
VSVQQLHVNWERLRGAASEWFVAAMFLLGVTTLPHCMGGCRPVDAPTRAETNYTADIMACSASAKTLKEARECRASVNQKYGLCGPAEWPRITPCSD